MKYQSDLANTSDYFFEINGLSLRVNPEDILVIDKRNLETYPVIRSDKAFTVASKFTRTVVNVVMDFDADSGVDMANLIRLCTYLDLYPFIFVKSQKLQELITHTSELIADCQIYGVENYQLRTDSQAQGVYFLTLTLLYFNHTPFARKLSFFDIRETDVAAENVFLGDSATVKKTSTVFEVGAQSDVFQSFFATEYTNRMLSYSAFLNEKKDAGGDSFFSIKMPYVIPDEDWDKVDDYKEVIVSRLNPANKPTDSVRLDQGPPLENMPYRVGWIRVPNPSVVTGEHKNLREYNLNSGSLVLSGYSITKHNHFVSQNMTGWTYPILQYLGRGRTELNIEFAGTDNLQAGQEETALATIKATLATVDASFSNMRQLSIWNVIKLDSVMSIVCPAFGFVLENQATKLNSADDIQGAIILNINMRESDNTGRLTNSETEPLAQGYKSAGAKAGINQKSAIKDILALIDAIGARKAARTNNGKPVTGVKVNKGFKDKVLPFDKDGNRLPSTYFAYQNELEKKYNLPKDLLYYMMMEESFNSKLQAPSATAVSSSNARGLYQWLSSSAADFNLDTIADIQDPYKSARATAEYMAQNLVRFDGDLKLALAGYNAGPNKVGRVGTAIFNDAGVTKYVNAIAAGVQGAAFEAANFDSDDANTKEIKDTLTRLQDALLENLPAVGVSSTGKERYVPLANYLKSADTINGRSDQVPIFKQLIESAITEIANLGAGGNPIATVVLVSSDAGMTQYIEQLEDKFRVEGVPDLNIKKNLPDISKLEVSDYRDVDPFYFLKFIPYFTHDSVSSVNSNILSLFADNDDAVAVQKRLRNVLRDLDDTELKSFYKEGTLRQDETKIANPKVAKDIFYAGEDAVNLDEDSQDADGDFFEVTKPVLNPFNINDIVRKQNDSIASYFKHGMNLAFPVVKVFIVEGDETNIGNYFSEQEHNFYELNGLFSLRVATNNDYNPVDILYMSLANPANAYTDKATSFDKYKPKMNFGNTGTEHEVNFKLNQLLVQVGTRLIVKAGYGNNVNKMDTIFNGIITDAGGEHIIEVVAEGFGRELVAVEHGDDPKIKNTFFMNASTESILANALNSGEVEHFGNFKFTFEKDLEAKNIRRAAAGIFGSVKYTLKFANIWYAPIKDADGEFDASAIENNFWTLGVATWYNYPIYKMTPWDILKEMEYRHPGTLSKPAIYGDRMTYFFGQKEQLYLFKPVDDKVLATGEDVPLKPENTFVAPGGELIDRNTGKTHVGFQSTQPSDRSSNLYNSVRSSRFKPICEYHVATSDHNIISNKLRLSDDFATVVSVNYSKQTPAEREMSFDTMEVKIDDNIRPSAHRDMTLSMPGCVDQVTAARYGSVAIKKEAERMYDGQIVLIGNPRIKAGDFMTINDKFRNMEGLIKVRECTHHFSYDEGFQTVITPGLFVETNFVEYPLTKTFQSLHAAMMILSDNEHEKAQEEAISNQIFRSQNLFVSQYAFGSFTKEDIQLSGALGSATILLSAGTVGATFGFIGEYAKSRSILKAIGVGVGVLTPTQAAATTGVMANISGKLATVTNFGKKLWNSSKLFRYTAGGVVTIGASIIIENVFGTYYRKLQTRQPVRIYPIKISESEATAGIYGFRVNGPFDSIGENIEETINDATILWNAISAGNGVGY